jgi:hypothetical protein
VFRKRTRELLGDQRNMEHQKLPALSGLVTYEAKVTP